MSDIDRPPLPLGGHPGATAPEPAAPPGEDALQRIEALRRVGAFADLPGQALRALADRIARREVQPGEVVVVEGEVGDALYVIERGTLVVETAHGGQPRRLARLGPGEFFGEVALLTGQPRGATVRADGAASLWRVDGTDLQEVLAAHPGVAASIAATADVRTQEARQEYGVEHLNLATLLARSGDLRIGRSPDNDLVLQSRLVSAHHAVVREVGGGYEITDLASSNGTMVNGTPVQRARLKDGDSIWIADQRLVFDEQDLQRVVEPRGIRIDGVGLRKEVGGGKTLLQDISLSILGGEFVAIVGGSGAGKSTLMDALSGVRPPTGGTVLYNGEDVSTRRELYRHSLGYVPQDDIIHRELPVRTTLDYAARLRLPLDTSAQDRAVAVDESLAVLGLERQRDVKVQQLSGGQRKRASIGVELLTQPRVFFLDEPTSGLDPATDTRMMELMRDLARSGSTVVLTTHATANVVLCDKVVFLARGGYLAFVGPPARALEYFGVERFDQIYVRLEEERSPEEWATLFRTSADHARTVGPPAGAGAGGPGGAGVAGGPHAPPRRRRFRTALRQFTVLSRRTTHLYLANPVRALPLAGPPILFSLMLLALLDPGIYDRGTEDPAAALQLTFMLALTAFVFGLLYGVQEIVKEFPIFRRERLVDQGVIPYVLSKATFLAPVLVVATVVMIGVQWATGRLPDSGVGMYAELLVSMSLASFAGLGLALFTSALAPDPQTATDLVTVWVMPQILFAGALFPVPTMAAVGRVVSHGVGTRWALEGVGRSLDLDEVLASASVPLGPELLQQYGDTFSGELWPIWLILAGFAVVPMLGAALVLRRRTRRQ